MKYKNKKIMSYLVLGVILSQGIGGATLLTNVGENGFTVHASPIISDEASIATLPKIISEEALLQVVKEEVSKKVELSSAPENETVVEAPKVTKVYPVVSTKSYEIARTISDRDLLKIFVQHKSTFKGKTSGNYNYEGFIKSWKELSRGYSSKTSAEALYYKQVFIDTYLHLK